MNFFSPNAMFDYVYKPNLSLPNSATQHCVNSPWPLFSPIEKAEGKLILPLGETNSFHPLLPTQWGKLLSIQFRPEGNELNYYAVLDSCITHTYIKAFN